MKHIVLDDGAKIPLDVWVKAGIEIKDDIRAEIDNDIINKLKEKDKEND